MSAARPAAPVLLRLRGIALSFALLMGAPFPTIAPIQTAPAAWAADLDSFLPPERPDDPPGKPAKALPGAREAATITFGRFTSVQVNVSPSGADIVGDAANEPSIAVDPTNHLRMVIGWRQFDTISSNFRQAGYGHTVDGGATWSTGKIEPGVFRSDPVLGFDAAGKFFYNSLMGNLTSQIFPSTNGGASWGASTFAYGGDKQWMTIDRTGGPGSGFIHQAWSTASNNYTPNTYDRSVNGGASFQSPSTIPGSPIWGTLDVASDGTLYVAGISDATGAIYVARSTNAMNAAVTPVFTTVSPNLGGTIETGGPNPAGLLGQVWIGVDRSSGPRAGWVYVLASVRTATDPMDVHIIRSADGGQTWSAPIRVNDDPAGNRAWQWFATMSVAPDGRLEAVWNDSRLTGDSTRTAPFYSYSTDGGFTWSANEQASPVWNSRIGWPNQSKIGDYYHMVSDLNGADLAWAATFNGGQDVYYMRIPRLQPVSVEDPAGGFRLHSGEPNPFTAATTIAFDLPPAAARVKLAVFDVGGRHVATLVDGVTTGGAQVARWNGKDDATGRAVPPGVYLCRLEAPGLVETRRLLRLR